MELDDEDRRVIHSWPEIKKQIEAQAAVKKKIKALMKTVGEGLSGWRNADGFRTTFDQKDGEFFAYRREWKRKGTSWQDVSLVVGGFAPDYLLTPDGLPYACVYSSVSDSPRFSEAEETALSEFIRSHIAPSLDQWDSDTDTACPICQYLLEDDYLGKEELYLTPGRLNRFVAEHLERLLPFAAVIDDGLRRLRAGEFK
ncbi:MAG: hypothetical protein ACKVU1_09040 [bacterium]